MPSVSRRKGPIHLGLDVHKDSISMAILHPRSEAVDVERTFHDEVSVRRLIARFPDPAGLLGLLADGHLGFGLIDRPVYARWAISRQPKRLTTAWFAP